MKKQQKKAFTLVELLVVIAILAILSTVAVVGYTSFIKKAAISNDENVVAQMNRYLEALKADATSGFDEIDESNIGALLAELKKNGMDSVEPYAEKYGYHYYFNEELQKFELIDNNDRDVLVTEGAGTFSLLRGNAAADGEFKSLSPYAAFTQPGYFFADLGGEWADIIDKFDEVLTYDNVESLNNRASEMTIGGKTIPGLYALINATVFVTENGNHVMDVEKVHKNVVVQPEATGKILDEKTGLPRYDILGYKKDKNGTKPINEENPLIVPFEANQKVEIPNTVTYVAPNFITYAIGVDAKVEVDGTNVEATVKVIVDQNTAEELQGVLDQGTKTSTNITVVNANGVTVEVTTTETTDALGNKTVKTEVKVGIDDPVEVENKNKVTSFKFDFTHNENTKEIDDTSAYIAWHGGSYQFVVDENSFLGQIKNQPVVSKEVEWTIHSINGISKIETIKAYEDYVTISPEGLLTLTGEYENVPDIDEIVVQVASKIPAKDQPMQYTLKVVRIDELPNLMINGKPISELDGKAITLLNNGTATEYAITHDAIKYGKHEITDLCPTDISVTYTGTGDVQVNSSSIKVNGEGSGELVIELGKYFKYTVKLSTANTSNFAFVPVNTNLTVLGNENAVKLSDLFKLREGATLPEGVQLVISKGQIREGDTYMTPDRLESDIVASNYIAINSAAFENYSIQFTDNSGANTIRIYFMQNGVRISEDVIVTVVDAVNVKAYTEFALNDSKAFTKNIVLLGDITMASEGYMTIGKGYTLYGNGFTFDVTKGRREDGIITLAGTLRDVKIIGEVYPNFAFSRGDEYGSSAVLAKNGAYIYNSYISNTRAPLMVNDGTVIIENSVLFGGRYANVDMVGGTLTIRGTVTTVQQVVEAADGTKVVGLGISAWFNDAKMNIVVEEDANLLQYNFVANTDEMKGNLPPMTLIGYKIMDLKKPFNHIFENTAEYGNYVFTVNGVQYANSGMIATDKYSLNYRIEGNPSGTVNKVYNVGAIKTVKVKTAVADDEEFIIVYDTRFTPKVGNVVSTGYVKVTGAQLKAGVKFEVNTKIEAGLFGASDTTPYLFQIQSDAYKSINVTGASQYNSLTYTFDEDLSGVMGLVNSVYSMHDKGLHYGKMCVDVYTVENTNTTYQQLLANYLAMGDFYHTDVYEFVNGSIVNYTPTK